MLNWVIVGTIKSKKGHVEEDEPVAAFAQKRLADSALEQYKKLHGVGDCYDSLEIWDYDSYFDRE